MEIFITETAPSPSGEEVVCKITVRDGRNVQHVKGEIAADFFPKLSIPLKTTAQVFISEEKFEQIEYAMKKTDAIKAGLNLLSFAPNTKRALIEKLLVRGVKRDVAVDAVEFIASCGYINEYEMALGLVDDMANRRGYGRLRIKNELFSKGFEAETSARALEDSEIDYIVICAERIKKMGGTAAFAERDARMKNVSSLMRCGFTIDEIKEALTKVKSEE